MPKSKTKPKSKIEAAHRPLERREKTTWWVSRGRYAIQVQVDVVYPVDDPNEPCFEPETTKFLDEIARRANDGDIEYLRSVGQVFEEVA